MTHEGQNKKSAIVYFFRAALALLVQKIELLKVNSLVALIILHLVDIKLKKLEA